MISVRNSKVGGATMTTTEIQQLIETNLSLLEESCFSNKKDVLLLENARDYYMTIKNIEHKDMHKIFNRILERTESLKERVKK